MIKQWLIKLLGIFSRTEKPTEDELIAYGAELERERQRKGYVHIYIDPTVRSYSQGPVTDQPKIIPTPRGRYFQEQRGEYTETKELPNVKMPHKLHFKRYDGPPLPDTTMAHIPTWIN